MSACASSTASWQATVNQISTRFLIFALSSLCLIALTLHAAMAVFGWHHG